MLVAQAHFVSSLATNPAFFFFGVFVVEFAINFLRGKVFATLVSLVGIAHLGSLTPAKPHRQRSKYDCKGNV